MNTHGNAPFVSVAILTKNGGATLEQLISNLLEQEFSGKVEIIVVDSGSLDRSLDFIKETSITLYHICPERFCFGPVRQLAFALTHGDYIVTLSQDVLPINKNYLASLVGPLVSGEADVVQGTTRPPEGAKVFFWEKVDAFYFTNEARSFYASSGGIGLSCSSLAITRTAWEISGFGDAPYCEDKLLQVNLQRRGLQIVVLPEPTAWHGHEYSIKSLAKRCYNEGVGWRYAFVKYSLKDLVWDLFIAPWSYRKEYLLGLKTRRINSLASLFFFQIRPLCLFIGNRLINYYWR